MRLIEHDGKSILRKHGVALPAARLLEASDGPEALLDGACVLKAQTLDGGRGKRGLILMAKPDNGAEQLAELRRRMADLKLEDLIMVEAATPPEKEFYLSVRIDGPGQCATLMLSAQGGMEVENGEPPVQIRIDPRHGVHPHELLPQLRETGFPENALAPVARFAVQLYRVFLAEDAELIEINPLGLTADGKLIALDCKMELDDSAAFRHLDRAGLRSATIKRFDLTPLEEKAAAKRLAFVELGGNVAVLTSGAGLGMAVVDALRDKGLSAANFIDAPAGISLEAKIDTVFEMARAPHVEAIGIFILQTAQPLKRTVSRLLELLDQAPSPKPMAIGMVAAAGGERGMTLAEARAELNSRGYQTVETFDELAKTLSGFVSPVVG
ncbi:ADP-forming succinate--CoA ligase subunit beta [soil metagenome]